MADRTIIVTGKATIKVHPDVTRLSISLCSLHDTYPDAYNQAQENLGQLSFIMREVNLEETLPKTTFFSIDKKTRSDYDKNNHFIGNVFIGLELRQQVQLDLGMDRTLLHRILTLIGERMKHAEIRIGHTVKDPLPFELQMIETAVKDAHTKATIMAKACGETLGPVLSIQYATAELHIYSELDEDSDMTGLVESGPTAIDIHPIDQTKEKQVTVTWLLDK